MSNDKASSHSGPADSTGSAAYGDLITEEMTRRNARVYLISYLLIYFAAPAVYIGIVQAALIDKLGASATMANLPLAGYKLGALAPLIFSWLVPHRLERNVVVWANVVTTTVMSLVFLSLVVPASDELRINVIILQGLLQGFSGSTSMVFQLQCLTRGTTPEGPHPRPQANVYADPDLRGRGLAGLAVGARPEAHLPRVSLRLRRDLSSSRTVHWRGRLESARGTTSRRSTTSPANPCSGICSPVSATSSSPSLCSPGWAIGCGTSCSPLFPTWRFLPKQSSARTPRTSPWYQNALQFGFKSLGGYGLGLLAMRYGLRMSALVSSALLGASVVWAWTTPAIGTCSRSA